MTGFQPNGTTDPVPDQRVDVWALGVVVDALPTGRVGARAVLDAAAALAAAKRTIEQEN